MNIDQVSGFIAGVLSTLFIVGAALEIVGYWNVFAKVGEKSWKSIIPIYRKYVIYKSVWSSGICWIWLAAVVLDSAITNYMSGAIQIVGTVLAVIAFIIDVIFKRRMSRSFGHGVGFTIGLVLIEPLFIFILGFDKSQYLGVIEVPKKKKKKDKKTAVQEEKKVS